MCSLEIWFAILQQGKNLLSVTCCWRLLLDCDMATFSEILQRGIPKVIPIHKKNSYKWLLRWVSLLMLAVPGLLGSLLKEWKEENSAVPVSCNMYKPVWHNTKVFQIGFCFLFIFFFFLSNLAKFFHLKLWHKNIPGDNQKGCSFYSNAFIISEVIYSD